MGENDSDQYLSFIFQDVLGGVSGVTCRAMFGGYGLYKDQVIFAIIVNNQLYFKVDQRNRAQYEAYDSQPFSYEKNGKSYQMSY